MVVCFSLFLSYSCGHSILTKAVCIGWPTESSEEMVRCKEWVVENSAIAYIKFQEVARLSTFKLVSIFVLAYQPALVYIREQGARCQQTGDSRNYAQIQITSAIWVLLGMKNGMLGNLYNGLVHDSTILSIKRRGILFLVQNMEFILVEQKNSHFRTFYASWFRHQIFLKKFEQFWRYLSKWTF
jgi:hypothetical protein